MRGLDDFSNLDCKCCLMSPKTHLIFNPFFLAYYKINVDSYAEMWIFYSSLIFQKNTAEAKITAKTKRDQPISRNEVTTEVGVATRRCLFS